MLAIIGNGKFYSSGNDLKSMMSGVSDTPTEILAQRAYDNHISFVDAFIDFPKPIAAMVNGPAIGIGKSQNMDRPLNAIQTQADRTRTCVDGRKVDEICLWSH